MESRSALQILRVVFFRAMLSVKFSHTFDFLVSEGVATDTTIGPCCVAIAHARLSEIGRE